MARIIPFRGILYDPKKTPDLKAVITPPYDVISETEQEAYYKKHPQNMIRLVLGKVYPEDNDHNNRYTRAAQFFRSWLDQGILRQDTTPAFYLTEIDYRMDGEVHTRSGFIALVKLESFEKRTILPHEQTFSATKADRFKLMKACRANFCPIFSLFPDPENEIFRVLRSGVKRLQPDFDFEDEKGYRHRLWRVKDQQIHEKIGERLTDRSLYIADGHHRYETALKYRDYIMSQQPTLASDDPCNFVMMYLSSMHDAGLAIRPVHRVLCDVEKAVTEAFVHRAHAYFDIETLDFDSLNGKQAEEAFLAKVRTDANSSVIGAALQGRKSFYVLRLKEGIMDHLFGREIPGPLRKLDVTMVTKLVLQKILGLNGVALDDEQRILYTSRADKALDAVHTGKCAIALILNPTRLDQIQEVSNAGLTMPRKSTYFYPKVMSGLVINKIGD
ncbi:MAG: DUF1015 domain-containing protein [Deltaproteobacteria bacterium]|nr:DUF1015 domain-containing protein [Deltaproteobacteria bacterium]MBW2020061.1 DUF1015 domain-containing protein [Deltaproteobacteria bacterium]MBW2074871.1 DUF1015 domain-containing protein [Deltaproteobacteria bacterium]